MTLQKTAASRPEPRTFTPRTGWPTLAIHLFTPPALDLPGLPVSLRVQRAPAGRPQRAGGPDGGRRPETRRSPSLRKERQMKKLRLDDLSVESFDTTRKPEEQRGTVHGNSGGIYSCEYCESFVECTADSCHPFTCSGSFDYTFCESDCCHSNPDTCVETC
jgi:hypothetical protein